MIKQTFSSARLAYLSLYLVGLMWVLPFIHVSHTYPLTTFYQEWWSAFLGVLAIGFLVVPAGYLSQTVPRITLLPVGLIGVALLQWLLGKIGYFDQVLLYVLYFLFAALLMYLGACLRDVLGLQKVSQGLALALLIGAELNAVIGVVQHFGWHTLLDPLIAVKMSSVVYGNLAQPNHFADYLSLGLISIGFLMQQQKIKPRWVVFLVLPVLFVMAMSGSRSSWLYLLLSCLIAWWMSRKNIALKPLVRYSFLLIIGFALIHFLGRLSVLSADTESLDTVGRMLHHPDSGDIRLYLWREAVLIFGQAPLLGVGLGQFSWQHFQLLPELQPSNVLGLYNNAHNLILQFAAETGIVGLLIFVIFLGAWVKVAWVVKLEAWHWWGYAILGVLGIHSLLEYPLWYTYFLAIAAILLGAFEEYRFQVALSRMGRISLATVLIFGLLVLMQVISGYKALERTLAISAAPLSDNESASILMRTELIALHQVPLLSPYAELFMSDRMTIDGEHVNEKLALNSRVVHFLPIGYVVYRQALLLAQIGQFEQATKTWNQAVWSYPENLPFEKQKLTLLAAKDPVHFSGLLEFSLQKK